MVRPLAPPADAAGMGGAPATTRSQTDARRMRSTGALLALIGRVQARGERAGVDSDTFSLRSREVALVIFLSDCPFTLNCKTLRATLQGARKGLECCPALARPAAPLPEGGGWDGPRSGHAGRKRPPLRPRRLSEPASGRAERPWSDTAGCRWRPTPR